VDTALQLALEGLRRSAKVAAAGDRDADGRLDLGDRPPVSPRIVALRTRTTMDGQSLDARGLQPGCHLEVVPAREIPAQPDFDRDRNRNRLDDRRRHPTGSVGIAKQRRTARRLDDLRYRAAHIDVDNV